ncbi:MAG: AI-2E family transporter [Pseudomonadota bacterium]|nr:AI-2E family transporter [Pseudomonadota bacterium]
MSVTASLQTAPAHAADSARPEPPQPFVIAAWITAAFLLWFVLHVDLLPALLAGLLVFELVHLFSVRLTSVREQRARLLAVAVIATLVVGLLGLAAFAAALFFKSDHGGYVVLLEKATDVIQSWRHLVPGWAAQSIPDDADALRVRVVAWLQEHVAGVRAAGQQAMQILVRVVIGMVIGALIALRQAEHTVRERPLARALANRAQRFGEAFRCVVFAQVRIAAINAALTALYLAVILPLTGVHLPLVKTMIFVTFVAGLIPVIGNLISNCVVIVVSLSVSPYVAGASLLYLVLIHKLEYFLNARMVGKQIRARAWELLLAMLAMEATFGIVGLIAAPIYYAYLKDELAAKGWV